MNKFHGDLKGQGIAVAKDTLHAYLAHLEDAFLIRSLSVASESERRRMVNPRKIYPIDPGLIPVYDRSGKSNVGHALETCVLLELERRGAEIAYCRTASGFEVDFLARYHDGQEDLIQVCADLDTAATKEREGRALLEAAEEYKRASLWLITLEPQTARDLPEPVTVHSAVAWLLGPEHRRPA